MYLLFVTVITYMFTPFHKCPPFYLRCFRVRFNAYLCCFFFFHLFQQLTGERKQMAKAIAAVNKSSKSSTFKKRPSTSTPTLPPSKRCSFSSDKSVVCYNCQQPGHISPRCPSRPSAASTSAAVFRQEVRSCLLLYRLVLRNKTFFLFSILFFVPSVFFPFFKARFFTASRLF